jgi:tRNA 2-selenouridine synthase
MTILPVTDFLELDAPLLDVRAPSEFADGHIPAAISMPLFSDLERAEVGTLYKQNGQKKAIKRGLQLVGPKMIPLIEKAEQLKSKILRVHCWRGGMRSQSVAWLLETYGFEISLLEGGYKSYRREMLASFERPFNFRVITGYTGSKKTLILHALEELKEQVLDLEGLANHQGSSFGNALTSGQPSTEHFHNLLFEKIRSLDRSKPIWVEDESNMIGHCNLPRDIFLQKEAAPHILIHLPLDARLDHLVSDYGSVAVKGLISATEGIRKRLGHQRADKAIELIEAGELKQAAAIILSYYDRMYQRSIEKKEDVVTKRITFDHGDVKEIAKHLKNGN